MNTNLPRLAYRQTECLKMHPAGHARVPPDAARETRALPKTGTPLAQLYVKEQQVNTLIHRVRILA
jgi:hypothetical protein